MKILKKIAVIFVGILFACALGGCIGTGDEGGNVPPIEDDVPQIKDIYSYRENSVNIYDSDNIPYGKLLNSAINSVFITPYLAENPTGEAVIVFPGGAYSICSNDIKSDSTSEKEASCIATEFYNAVGISVFVVRYRTTSDSRNTNYRSLITDAQRAIKYVRYNAENYGVDSDKIGVLGYSAGGNLAMQLCLHDEWLCDDENYTKDDIDLVSARPDFGVPSYAVCSFNEELTDNATKVNFTKGDEELIGKYSGENAVTEKTPPLFIWGCNDDKLTKGANLLAQRLAEKGIEYEYHTFFEGGHGIGTAASVSTASQWGDMSKKWIKRICGNSETTEFFYTEERGEQSIELTLTTDFFAHPSIQVDGTDCAIVPFLIENSAKSVIIMQDKNCDGYIAEQGRTIAEQLNKNGMSAFILHYADEDVVRQIVAARKFIIDNKNIFGVTEEIELVAFGNACSFAIEAVFDSEFFCSSVALCNPLLNIEKYTDSILVCKIFICFETKMANDLTIIKFGSSLIGNAVENEVHGYNTSLFVEQNEEIVLGDWFNHWQMFVN